MNHPPSSSASCRAASRLQRSLIPRLRGCCARLLAITFALGALHCSSDDADPLAACHPRTVGGPFWLTEGETVQIEVECATGATPPGAVFELVEPPPNTSFDEASRTLTFTPGLDQAGVYALQLAVAGSPHSGQVEVQVADRFDAPGNTPVNPATYTEELGLPVLHLRVDPAINDAGYLPASITYRGHEYHGAQAKYRGQSSLRYAKKSFTLKFAKDDRFGDPLSVAGFTGKRKVTLTSTFDDNSYLRTRLSLELWNRIGAEHVQVQAYSVVVYLDGAFWGLYTLTDHVDRHLMEDHGLSEDGNLYKARDHHANFRLTRADQQQTAKRRLSEGYTKEEGTPLEGEEGASADLEALVRWVAGATWETFVRELDTHLVQREYEDWWLLVSLIIARDSAGKNSYHYSDPRAFADARFHVVPWDFNDSFGQTWLTDSKEREATRDPEELARYNLVFERLVAHPETRARLIERYRSALANEWELGSVLESFDTWSAEIDGVAARDESRWSASSRSHFARFRSSPTTRIEERAFLRQWIIDRWTFVSSYY